MLAKGSSEVKIKMKIRLVAEDRRSIGRILTLMGIFLCSTFLVVDVGRIALGNEEIYTAYTMSDWFILGVGYILSIFFIIGGFWVHRVSIWPEFEIRIYEDGWLWYKIHGNGQIKDTETWIPGDLLVRIKRYKRKYSKIRKNWYIWLYLDFVYGEKAYTAKAYGWLEEPKEIKRFDEFIAKIEGIIKDNTGGKEVKIPFSMRGYGVHSWNELDYAKKIKEEREQMISGKEEW